MSSVILPSGIDPLDAPDLFLANKRPAYISPSSLMASETQPHTFALQRLTTDNPMPREPQGLAAAVGSAFDCYVKYEVAKRLSEKGDNHLGVLEKRVKKYIHPSVPAMTGMSVEELQSLDLMDFLLTTCVEPQHNEVALPKGRTICDIYMRDIYHTTKYDQVEIDVTKSLGVVPVMGKLDFTCNLSDPLAKLIGWHNNHPVPADWKIVGGATGKGAMKGKYYNRLDGGVSKGAHKLYRRDILMSEIDNRWATQLGTYGMLLGLKAPYPVVIECGVVRNTGIRFAKYIGWIDELFENDLLARYRTLWNSIIDGSFVEGLTSPFQNVIFDAARQENWF